ncbi:MAG: hypothetical protein ACOZHQ_10080 [Thermodesulfobacteriota bacterium]
MQTQNTADGGADPELENAMKVVKAHSELHHGEVLDYIDIVERVSLPLILVVEACHALATEGGIAAVD